MGSLKSNLTEYDKRVITEQYARGYGCDTIARRLGLKSSPVKKYVEDQGLTRTREEAQRAKSYDYQRHYESKASGGN